jgi:hypothetical protein
LVWVWSTFHVGVVTDGDDSFFLDVCCDEGFIKDAPK